MFTNIKTHYSNIIEQIKQDGLFKNERVITSPQSANIEVTGGQKVLNLCANNYLGLANNPDIIKAAKESYDKWGYGLSSVRFICGTQQIHKELEKKISGFLEMDDT
ncbi:MAG: aminotransferase class I/II-fold pyridoxal phosphate-dependent enzyme, partial [Ignavibacteria bacterium]|nr:aminotransferase class I/II-fold pyridoxal phosphate-dependent enzyme [Ignavibacteria bacterium]